MAVPVKLNPSFQPQLLLHRVLLHIFPAVILRHTCASRLVNAGIDLYVVKEWLGHSSIQVTEKYAHLAPHKLSHAAKILDDLT
jgi:site-specific recombinase XerD